MSTKANKGRPNGADLSRYVVVATHVRSTESFARVVDPAHYAGLWRAAADPGPEATGRRAQ
jgi:hypothetical protein